MPIGKLEPFNISSQQWPAYIRRVNQYILLNDIKSELKVSLLITVVGEATYSMMCDLCSPSFPENKSYDELVQLVTQHLEPKRSEIAERHVFRLRRQRAGEPLMEYLQALKHLAATCNFGKCKTCSTLEENSRDQFVSGLANDAMRSRIFAEREIVYKEAVELALALEAAEKHAEVSGNTGPHETAGAGGETNEVVHYARGADPRARRLQRASDAGAGGAGAGGAGAAPAAASPRRQHCWRCGKPHGADRCRFKNYNCECGQKGHLKVMCKRMRSGGSRQNFVSDDSEEDGMFDLELTNNEPVYVRARPVPLALRARVENELIRLERDGTIYPVDYSDYGTPIVPVVKENGEIRICGDYKITINPKLKRDYYPLPRIEELFASLSGGRSIQK
ncbi:uncharacterized protein ACR2FA_009241 [Aphomia sociella]